MSLGFQTEILFFSITVELFETENYVKVYRNTGLKIETNGSGHLTKTAVMPIFG